MCIVVPSTQKACQRDFRVFKRTGCLPDRLHTLLASRYGQHTYGALARRQDRFYAQQCCTRACSVPHSMSANESAGCEFPILSVISCCNRWYYVVHTCTVDTVFSGAVPAVADVLTPSGADMLSSGLSGCLRFLLSRGCMSAPGVCPSSHDREAYVTTPSTPIVSDKKQLSGNGRIMSKNPTTQCSQRRAVHF